jgi:acyl-CoA thioesterase FadM
MVSRWPVLVSLPVSASDRDNEGKLNDAAIDRLFAAARAAYLERCSTVDPAALEASAIASARGAPAGDGVTVSVNVVEVFPSRFTMEARIRPADGEGIAGTASCTLSPEDGVSTEMRDEFIALAHGAAHFH